MKNLISVIVTIYNREKFLDECLTSIKNQTFTNYEVLMVDDGSTDDSSNIAKAYATIDKRFKYIPTEHIGFPAAKNLGLEKATGKYIIFLDSDDSAYPCWLELLYNAAEMTGSDISTCYYDEYLYDETKDNKKEEPPTTFYKEKGLFFAEYEYFKMNLIYNKLCSSYLWNKLIRKELYEDIRFKDQIAISDISEIYKIVDKANKVIQVQVPLVHYRRHQDSMGIESAKSGVDYFKFRADVLEQSASFVWEHYPQSRFVTQLTLSQELKRILKEVGPENFKKYIDREFFRKVFSEKPDKYLFKN